MPVRHDDEAGRWRHPGVRRYRVQLTRDQGWAKFRRHLAVERGMWANLGTLGGAP
jgi:hypothetical protein